MNFSQTSHRANQKESISALAKTTKTILVVDDDESVRELTEHWLQTEGYQVVTAKNGSEAIDRLKSVRNVDAIILDVQMPVMNGDEVLNEMRAGGYLDTIPVLIVSANRHLHAHLEAKEVLLKPVSKEKLLSSVKDCFKDRKNKVR